MTGIGTGLYSIQAYITDLAIADVTLPVRISIDGALTVDHVRDSYRDDGGKQVTNYQDQRPEYWEEYSNLQHVKHRLIREYLNGWFPKLTLGTWGARRVIYVDTHAGRGKHLGGQLGSPLVALKTLLEHSSRARLLSKAEVRFFFIEHDEQNADALCKELEGYSLPSNVFVNAEVGNCFEILDSIVSTAEQQCRELAPSFVFCDPYGFRVPGSILRRLMRFRRVELFVNIIWRPLDMAIAQARGGQTPAMAEMLDSIFDGDGWNGIDSSDVDERAEQCVRLLRIMTASRWATYIRMLGKSKRTGHFLLHLTNHPAGRDLMKESVWKVCPEGGFYARRTDNPKQQILITPEPDFRPLEDWLREKLASGPKYWKALDDELREEL